MLDELTKALKDKRFYDFGWPGWRELGHPRDLYRVAGRKLRVVRHYPLSDGTTSEESFKPQYRKSVGWYWEKVLREPE